MARDRYQHCARRKGCSLRRDRCPLCQFGTQNALSSGSRLPTRSVIWVYRASRPTPARFLAHRSSSQRAGETSGSPVISDSRAKIPKWQWRGWTCPRAAKQSRGLRTERFNCRAKSDSLTIMVESCAGAPFRTWSWASKRENELHRQNEAGLCKSSKSATLCYTVSHLLFGRRKNRNREQAVKSITSTKCRDGGTGRRSGLKI